MHPRALTVAASLLVAQSFGQTPDLPDIGSVPSDLSPPPMIEGKPAPGVRAKVTAPEYAGTEVHHALYLPTNWKPSGRFPVIVEYAGNGPYRNKHGDVCTGRVEDCKLGYGISGGKDYLWVCLPYIAMDHQRNQLQWWGDLSATVDYCKRVVPRICEQFGGDPSRVVLAGFSRGAIACNFIGLHDDEIAGLWKGFICHSHYDGVRKWNYDGADREAAARRLGRLKTRPQFISHEGSVEDTQSYLGEVCPKGEFTFMALPFRNHTDSWVLRDIPERAALRRWLSKILGKAGPAD